VEMHLTEEDLKILIRFVEILSKETERRPST